MAAPPPRRVRLLVGLWCPVCGRDVQAVGRRYVEGVADAGEQDPRPPELRDKPAILSLYMHRQPGVDPCFVARTWDDGERVRDREEVPEPTPSVIVPPPGGLRIV